LRFFALCVVAAVLPACGRSESSPLPASGVRVVALSPGVAETLIALGLGETLVGRHAFDEFSPPGLPSVGDQAGIDYEALLRLAPTHVLLERSAAGAPPRLLQFAEKRGFEVHEIPLLTLADIRSAALTLPSMVDRPDAEDAATDLVARLDAAVSPAPGFAERAGRVLALYWTDPIGVAGPGSYHAEIIAALGGSLAVAEGRPYLQLDAEDVRRVDPDSLLLILPGADASRIDELLGPLRSLDLRAVRQGRVGLINEPRAQTPGPSAISVAEDLRAIVLSWPPLANN
jgi:ABC-type Fe3+-hydroxamate transport system substrate-binding protein